MLRDGGQWGTVSRPFIGTVEEGLDVLFSQLGTPKGVYGTDYGPTQPLTRNLSDYSTWQPTTARALIRRSTTPNFNSSDYKLSQFSETGFVDISAGAFAFVGDVYVDQFFIEGNAQFLNGVQQLSGAPRVFISNGDIQGQTNRCINISDGSIKSCLLQRTGADCLGVVGIYEVDNCLMRLAASNDIADPSAHGDLVQGNAASGSFTRNTMYLPATGSLYDEGVYGSTSVLLMRASSGKTLSDLYILGNLIAGGGYSIRIQCDNAVFRNCVIGNNRHPALTANYTAFGEHFISAPTNGGVYENIAYLGDFKTNGEAVPLLGERFPDGYSGGTGVFNWSKQNASAKFLEALRTHQQFSGEQYLDSNDNLLPEKNLGAIV